MWAAVSDYLRSSTVKFVFSSKVLRHGGGGSKKLLGGGGEKL